MQLQWIQAQGSRADVGASAMVDAPPQDLVMVAARGSGRSGARGGGTAVSCLRHRRVPVAAARFEVTLPEDMRVDSVYDRAAISPDGQRLVFSASLNGRTQLFMRDLALHSRRGARRDRGRLLPVLVTR